MHLQYPANAIACHVDIYIILFGFRHWRRLVFTCRKALPLSKFDLTCCFLVQPAASKIIVPRHWQGGLNKNVLSSNCNNLWVFRANSFTRFELLVLLFFQNLIFFFKLPRKRQSGSSILEPTYNQFPSYYFTNSKLSSGKIENSSW